MVKNQHHVMDSSKSGYLLDLHKITKIICIVDLIQPSCIIFDRAWSIIFRTAVNEDESFSYAEHGSSVVVILFAAVICFYIIHLTIALKLFTALQSMDVDPLSAARNAKVWQSWSIIYLVFLFGNLFASILSTESKLATAFAAVIGVFEIFWRLFGIYNVGLFIDDLITKIPATVILIPTVQFFGIRYPRLSFSRSIE